MSIAVSEAPRLPWYRVPEVWLILVLLGATVIGSIALVFTAVGRPDAPVAVPGDAPRPSKIPPIRAADPPAQTR
ncbi:hypothetical protein [Dokdonella koreensis]|uniref:Uncharacterized protein n=1 Tax=Dokdonella koreensis DS-123 TaxID=1300342 RepID=A0A160DW29_9GAMM|nr:hypothetical protein [Dokdonella koreensis]ANB18391.1 Hypothetical protein I596_2383 [Dokdonella koreensis DS-123]